MLHSYEAQLDGSHVTWLGVPPPSIAQVRHVVVVLDDPVNEAPQNSIAEVLQRARGALGRSSREAVLAQLAQSRQEWER